MIQGRERQCTGEFADDVKLALKLRLFLDSCLSLLINIQSIANLVGFTFNTHLLITSFTPPTPRLLTALPAFILAPVVYSQPAHQILIPLYSKFSSGFHHAQSKSQRKPFLSGPCCLPDFPQLQGPWPLCSSSDAWWPSFPGLPSHSAAPLPAPSWPPSLLNSS